jgi:iron(III) transport system ATP-binding protein
MATVRVENLRKSFGKVCAVAGISFEVEKGEFVTLLGGSGCGKTTTLRIIAGLEENEVGQIILDDHVVSNPALGKFVPPEKRKIGMVFQSYAIWPHMTVFENIAFPLKVRRVPPDKIREQVCEVLTMVGLPDLGLRMASRLSGGQQQRVAIARALACNPSILLMDEPLSNLDAKLRERMRFELREMQTRLGIATLYVTHDQAEAMVLSDRIIVMNEGHIEQVGTPWEIYEHPKSEFVSDFIGMANLLEAVVAGELGGERSLMKLLGNDRELTINRRISGKDLALLLIRPENVQLGRLQDLPAENTWSLKVELAAYFGDHRQYVLSDGDVTIRAKTGPKTVFNRGDAVGAHISADNVVVVEKQGKQISGQFLPVEANL